MSKINVLEAARKFSYRNITKEFHPATKEDPLSLQFHLELGEKNEVIIVEDRKVDWVELANRDIDQVGLANVLEMAKRKGEDLAKFMFKDNEALDLANVNPMDPQSVNATLKSQSESTKKLEDIASQLGISVSDLVAAAVNGSLEKVISEKVNAAKSDDKEGDK